MSRPAEGVERYQDAYASPPTSPYFSPRLAALGMLLAKIQVTSTLAVSSPVEGAAPSRDPAQRKPRWLSARGATRKRSAPYPTSLAHSSVLPKAAPPALPLSIPPA